MFGELLTEDLQQPASPTTAEKELTVVIGPLANQDKM